MKRIFLAVSILLLAISAWGAPLVAGPNEAFVLLNNSSVFQEKSMGVLDWMDSVTIGDKVTLLSGIVKLKFEGKEREYYKAKLPNGKEGFIRSLLLGVGGSLGVIKTDKALTYSEPRDVKITTQSLSRAQIVVVLKDGSNDQFTHVVGYDAAKDVSIADLFVSVDDVSTIDVDINAVVLLTVAKSQKNDTLKKNLLTVAANKYSGSQFNDMVKAALDAGGSRAVKAATGNFVVNDNNVNIRDLPNENGGKVLGALTKGQSVSVVEVTADSYTIGGVSAPWYHLSSPSGWVFGSFLTAAP